MPMDARSSWARSRRSSPLRRCAAKSGANACSPAWHSHSPTAATDHPATRPVTACACTCHQRGMRSVRIAGNLAGQALLQTADVLALLLDQPPQCLQLGPDPLHLALATSAGTSPCRHRIDAGAGGRGCRRSSRLRDEGKDVVLVARRLSIRRRPQGLHVPRA